MNCGPLCPLPCRVLDITRVVCVAGEAVYSAEQERIFGQKAKVTARLADKAARRSQALAMSYSVSMVASYLLIWADSIARSSLAS